MDDFGRYWLNNQKSNELYTDYLLSYNKTFGDWSVSATAGWVGHTRKTESVSTDVVATQYDPQRKPLADDKVVINRFEANSGGDGATSKSEGSNWDKAALVTAQVGWKDLIYVDGSYRRDWYRAFKQFSYMGTPDNYGYFGFGANAIATTGGIVCDGAKASCASKIATAVEAGILGYNMHVQNQDFQPDILHLLTTILFFHQFVIKKMPRLLLIFLSPKNSFSRMSEASTC